MAQGIPEKGDGKCFTDIDEMLMAYQNHEVNLHSKIKVRMFCGDDDKRGKLVESTVGRFIFNEDIPQDIGFVEDRQADPYSLEIDFLVGKKELGKIIDKCYRKHGNTKTALMLDYIKDMGYHYSTKAAVSIGVSDMEIPKEKDAIIKDADKLVDRLDQAYASGLVSDEERYKGVIDIWKETTNKVADALMDSLDPMNNLNIMAQSGARGSKTQIQQIGGMRGLMANATGKTVEIPIKSNFREGLSVLDYFVSTNGARKGLADTALRTADSGYLTRRLVDVSHNIIVHEADCGTEEGIEVKAFTDEGKDGQGRVIEALKRSGLELTTGMFTMDELVKKVTVTEIHTYSRVLFSLVDFTPTPGDVIEGSLGESQCFRIESAVSMFAIPKDPFLFIDHKSNVFLSFFSSFSIQIISNSRPLGR